MFINLIEAGSDNMVCVMINHIIYITPDTESENTVIGLTGDIIFVVKEPVMDICKKIINRSA